MGAAGIVKVNKVAERVREGHAAWCPPLSCHSDVRRQQLLDQRLVATHLQRAAQAHRPHHGLQIGQRLLENIIDQDVIELAGVRNLAARVAQATLNDLGGVRAAAAQPALQLRPRRRQDEYTSACSRKMSSTTSRSNSARSTK
jgi:hypothetical protein